MSILFCTKTDDRWNGRIYFCQLRGYIFSDRDGRQQWLKNHKSIFVWIRICDFKKTKSTETLPILTNQDYLKVKLSPIPKPWF